MKGGKLVVEHNFSFKGLMPRKFRNEQCEGDLSRVLNHVETIQSKKRADHSGIGAITLLPTAFQKNIHVEESD